jgi:hypothetical protein
MMTAFPLTRAVIFSELIRSFEAGSRPMEAQAPQEARGSRLSRDVTICLFRTPAHGRIARSSFVTSKTLKN